MEEFNRETETTSTRLFDEIRHLHPNLNFCGEPRNAILSVSDGLLNYVLSLLKDDPIHAPVVSIEEWSELLSILRSHWVSPLLYWQLSRLPDQFLPPKPIVDRMRTTFQWSRTRCFHLERQLGEILAAFKNQGVRALVLKGPALGGTVYPDPALRPASDLDLLVLPDQVVRSRAILETLGYKCLGRRFELSRDYFDDEPFIFPKDQKHNRPVDIHWDLHVFSGIRRDVGVEDFFLRAVKVESSSLTFEALHPVDAIIHRAINNAFGHDHDMRLIWIYDIKLLAQHLLEPRDWVELQERSVVWRARLAMEHSLNMARVWAGLQLPHEFEDFSTWPEPTGAEVDAWSSAIRRHRGLAGLFNLHMGNSSNPLEKAMFFVHLLFPSPSYMRVFYPSRKEWLLPLSYGRRWWQWFARLIL